MISHSQVMINAANEGIPVAAIARIIAQPLDETYANLKQARNTGSIAQLPRADWPAGARIHERLPSTPLPSDDDLQFMCTKTFKLTGLEAGFLVVLLKHKQVEKSRLHNIVEQKRMTRQQQPSAMETTDPKMVDVMICKLRKKLKTVDPKLQIATIWGGGYYIETDVKPLIIAKLNGETHAAPQEPASPEPAITNGNPVAAVH